MLFDNEYMRKRFPDLIPIENVPSLKMINGIGFSVLGERDYDQLTNTYITTVFLFVLFIPVFAFGSFRVTEVSHQLYQFYGRVPMSRRVRIWNWIMLTVIASLVILIWWKTR
jgi:hypothetical protein